ncbi:membrane protein [Salmonella enterica subsp. enterica serovar Typhimurium]|nr:membrane protein [Salmonella enterica subsp. enterica serovar Typhimurium]
MYDPPFLEALMITASFFAIFYHYRCVGIAP